MASAWSRAAGRHSAKAASAASSLHSLLKRRASSCSAAVHAAVAAEGQGGSFSAAAAALSLASVSRPTSCVHEWGCQDRFVCLLKRLARSCSAAVHDAVAAHSPRRQLQRGCCSVEPGLRLTSDYMHKQNK